MMRHLHDADVRNSAPKFVSEWLVIQYAGSTAHGTYLPSNDPNHVDDIDILGVWMPTHRGIIGLEQAEHWMTWLGDLDIVTYEVRKFARLLLKANPNVLGMLWADGVEIGSHPIWDIWRTSRNAFLSMKVYDVFAGYAYAQLKRLGKPNVRGYMGADRKAQFAKYGYDIKNAAHCLRLLHMGIELMETGNLNVNRVGIDAEELISIKRGEWSLAQVERAAEAGFDIFHKYKAQKPFPQEPDYDAIEALVMDTLRIVIKEK